jgi:hypothetical protein
MVVPTRSVAKTSKPLAAKLGLATLAGVRTIEASDESVARCLRPSDWRGLPAPEGVELSGSGVIRADTRGVEGVVG